MATNTFGIKVPTGGRLPNASDINLFFTGLGVDDDTPIADVSDYLLEMIYEWTADEHGWSLDADAAQAWADSWTERWTERWLSGMVGV